ncbi:hypothetical protein HanPSC8_Chr08g0341511 [Helianthus annuus]|nr:hypothetical protein HanHA89_Chr08g0310231 [Helianthus annuus]KAJ0902811.1 hypothetical protein HanPSC8_Chr08g0341511 [Helianthus annuus]
MCNFPREFYSLHPISGLCLLVFLRYSSPYSRIFRYHFSPFISIFSFLLLRSTMTNRTRSHTGDSIPTFVEQNLFKDSEKEVCSFDNADIAALRASGAFPVGAIIRPFDRNIRSDVSSKEWICFLAYPFSIGLRYPFSDFIMHFFHLTGLSFAQTMPMVYRVLVVLDQIKTHHIPDLCIEDLPIAYRLRSHGSSQFLLFSTFKNPLILKATKNEDEWRRKFFFVKRESIDKGVDFPVKWLTIGRI